MFYLYCLPLLPHSLSFLFPSLTTQGWHQYHNLSEKDLDDDKEEFPDDIDFGDPALVALQEEKDHIEVVARKGVEQEAIKMD